MRKTTIFYYLFRFFQDAVLVYPVYVIMFRDAGLSFGEIARLLAIWAAAMMLLELPSGILADRWSRRGTLMLGMVAKAAAFLCWLLWPHSGGFLAGFLLWGAQEALCSGTTEALLYDSLLAEGCADDFEKVAGRGAFASRSAIVLAMAAGGWLYALDPQLVLGFSALAMLFSAACVLPLSEGRHQAASPGERPTLRDLARSAREAIRQEGMIPLLAFGSLAGAAWGVMDEYDTLYGNERGLPLALIGFWGALRFGMEGLGALIAPWLLRVLSIGRPPRLMVWLVAASALLVLGVSGPDVLLPGYFLFYLAAAAVEIVYQGKLQRRIESSGRATFSSLASLLFAGSGILIGLLYGILAGAGDLPWLFRGGAILVAACAVAYGIGRRHETDAPRSAPD